MKYESPIRTDDFLKINNMRKSMSLQPIRRGFRECLKCEDQFYSYDLINQKCCDKCRHEKDEENVK